MDSRIKDNNVDFLLSAVLKLETLDEAYRFFEDICTIPEVKVMAQRFVVARMLKEGWVYADIVAKTGASTATISRVSRSLHYGCNGYDMVFDRMSAEEFALLPKKDTDK